MDINNRSTTPKVKSPEEVYLKLTLASFHYHHLFSKDQRKMMRFVFANCTLGKIIVCIRATTPLIQNFVDRGIVHPRSWYPGYVATHNAANHRD